MQEVVRHGNDYQDHLNPAGLQDDTQLSEQLSLLFCVVSVSGRLDSCSELAWWPVVSSLSHALHCVRLVIAMSAVGSCFVESPKHSRPAFVTNEMLSQCWLPLPSTSAVARHQYKAYSSMQSGAARPSACAAAACRHGCACMSLCSCVRLILTAAAGAV